MTLAIQVMAVDKRKSVEGAKWLKKSFDRTLDNWTTNDNTYINKQTNKQKTNKQKTKQANRFASTQ